MDLVASTEITGLIIGVGGASVVVQKAVRALRRLGRVADGILGDGTKDHPGVVAGQEELKTAIGDLKDQATADLAEIRADLAAVKGDVAAVKVQTGAIEKKLDEHVDTVAPSLLADGQKWGQRLDNDIADHEGRITRLERTTGSDDPVVG